MRRAKLASFLIGLSSIASADVTALSPSETIAPGIYSNQEQHYFANEQGKRTIPLVMIKVDEDRRMEIVDAFGRPGQAVIENMTMSHAAGRIDATLDDGSVLELRRARTATCWTAISKHQPKADGSPDWHFVREVKLHDQGGRAIVGGGTSGADAFVIRMRNVIWPSSADGTPATNKPSIVLYIHKTDQPERAESYVWADPGASRIGVNLRWIQASCGIDGAEPKNSSSLKIGRMQ